jgi:hypothetical protein
MRKKAAEWPLFYGVAMPGGFFFPDSGRTGKLT